MKFNFNPNKVKTGVRIKSGFLIFPKIINKEFRWLEFAYWKQFFHIKDKMHKAIVINLEWID